MVPWAGAGLTVATGPPLSGQPRARGAGTRGTRLCGRLSMCPRESRPTSGLFPHLQSQALDQRSCEAPARGRAVGVNLGPATTGRSATTAFGFSHLMVKEESRYLQWGLRRVLRKARGSRNHAEAETGRRSSCTRRGGDPWGAAGRPRVLAPRCDRRRLSLPRSSLHPRDAVSTC